MPHFHIKFDTPLLSLVCDFSIGETLGEPFLSSLSLGLMIFTGETNTPEGYCYCYLKDPVALEPCMLGSAPYPLNLMLFFIDASMFYLAEDYRSFPVFSSFSPKGTTFPLLVL